MTYSKWSCGGVKQRAPSSSSPRVSSQKPASIDEGELVVSVRSYNRPAMLRRLLERLRFVVSPRLRVFVFDDHSTQNMSSPATLCRKLGWPWHRYPRRHGKPLAWKMFNHMFSVVKSVPDWSMALFLDDDCLPCDDFLKRISEVWSSIRDRRKAALTLIVTGRRGRGPCWTSVRPSRAGPAAWKTQWLDQAFLLTREALEEIDWELEPIDPIRWLKDPRSSTGVGMQLSCHLHRAQYGLFQSERSLVVHLLCESMMNPEERRVHRLEAVGFVDGASSASRLMWPGRREASLASIPGRVRSLEMVVGALLPQVDLLRVFLNGYSGVPDFLRRDGIEVATSADHGDLGDVGKFFWCRGSNGYQLTCDDDLFYAPDYVPALVRAIERYHRKAAVGVHGVVLRSQMSSYFKDRKIVHFGTGLERDRPVHLLGTGTVAFHSSALRLRREDFEKRNMADVWFALACQRQRVPRVAVARKKGWMRPLKTSGPTIYDTSRKDDSPLTEAIRRLWPWELLGPAELVTEG